MDELVAFLRAALDRDEQVARHAAHHDAAWQYADSRSGPTVRTGSLTEDLWSREGNPSVWTCDDVEDGCPDLASAWEAEGQHIARWDPARVLALMSALRTLLDGFSYEAGETRAIMAIGQALYGNEPGWRDEWQLSAPA